MGRRARQFHGRRFGWTCLPVAGKRDFDTPGNYLTDPMPLVGTLIGGELAWRQHEGGHDVTPNWPAFFEWVGNYIKAPAENLKAAQTSDAVAPQASVRHF